VKALVVMLVDLLDVSGTLMGKVGAQQQQGTGVGGVLWATRSGTLRHWS
jgi:hypothetical protein